MKITNTQKGPRGVNTVNGPVLIEPGETVEVDVFAREREHIEAAAWFETQGDYVADPGGSRPQPSPAATAPSNTNSAELDALRQQLAEREAELAKLRADELDRAELKKQAAELKIDYPRNVSNEKLKELIDAKLAE